MELDSSGRLPTLATRGDSFFALKNGDSVVECRDGKIVWSRWLQEARLTRIALADDGLIVVASSEGYLWCLKANGEINWRFRVLSAAVSKCGLLTSQ